MPTMTFDYPVTADALMRGPAHDACRAAVVWPLSAATRPRPPAGHEPAPQRPTLVQAHSGLIELWRRRVPVLFQHGWAGGRPRPTKAERDAGEDDPQAGRRFTYLYNCPPFSLHVAGPRGRPCGRPRCCPMCYARGVVHPAYAAVEWALWFGRREAQAPLLGGHRLAAVVREGEYPAADHAADADWLAESYAQRFNDLRRLPAIPAGSIVVSTVAPGRKPGTVVTRRATVVLAAESLSLAAWAEFKPRVLEPGQITRAEAARLVGWAAAYPRGMILGDAALAVRLYAAAASRHAKMLVTSGLLRNRGARQQAAGVTKRHRESRTDIEEGE